MHRRWMLEKIIEQPVAFVRGAAIDRRLDDVDPLELSLALALTSVRHHRQWRAA